MVKASHAVKVLEPKHDPSVGKEVFEPSLGFALLHDVRIVAEDVGFCLHFL
jgi:hypothetical protein